MSTRARYLRQLLLFLGVLLVWNPVSARLVFQHPLVQIPAAIDQVMSGALRLRGVETGPRGAPRLLIFFDPNCPFCAHFWQSFQAWHQRFRVRWIPIAYVKSSSLGRAVAILEAKDPWKALSQNEGKFHFQRHQGGLLPAFDPPTPLIAAIHRNTAFWHHHIAYLPVCFYDGRQGPHIMIGVPSTAQWQRISHTAQAHWSAPANP